MIGVIEAILAIGRICMIFGMSSTALSTLQTLEIVITIVWLGIIALLLYGIYLDNAEYLMPYLIVQVIHNRIQPITLGS